MKNALTKKSSEIRLDGSESAVFHQSTISPEKPLLNTPRSSSLLAQIRKQRNMSQRNLAKKMDITRTQLQRIENKKNEKLFLWELSLFAGALRIPLTDLVQLMEWDKTPLENFTRCSLDRPFTVIKFEDGVELDCMIENPRQSFVGRLNLSAQRSFPLKRLPGLGSFIFMVSLQGIVSVEGGAPMVLKEKDGFFGESLSNMIIHNTQPVQKASLLIFLLLNNA